MGFGINTRSQSQLLFREGLDSNMLEGYRATAPQWNRFLKSGSTNQTEIQRTRIAGPSRLLRSGEGEEPVMQTITVGDKVSAVDREYQGGYGVTRVAREDDLYGKINRGAFYLGNSARLTMEYVGASFLNDFFTGSVFPAMDGLAFGSSAHTLLNSASTVSNIAATPVGFSYAGVNQLLDLAGHAVDENGDPIEVNLDTLIIPNDIGIIQDARRIFTQVEQPGTANRDKNMIKDMMGSVDIIVSRYMTSAADYFIIDSTLNDAHVLMRKPLMVWDWVDDATGTTFAAARTRFIIYGYNWRGWYAAHPS